MEKQMRKLNKVTAGIAAGGIVVATAGVAYAAWNANGVSAVGNQGNAKSAAKQAITVSTTAPAGMYPTQADAGHVGFSVSNPNPYAITLTSASVTGVNSSCGAQLTDFAFGSEAVFIQEQAAKGSGAPATGTIAVTEVKNSLPDACQDSDISFQVTVAGASAPGKA